MVPRNTGETPTLEAGSTTRISRRQASTLRKKLVKIVLAATLCPCSSEQVLKVVEPKCKIQPTGAGEDETMLVRTS
ncbi:hypothetical protein I8752_23610 [Nostocaceae cyanobacterium CENA369]|uniref:Uncharacterized protein n=1 Tax=Dendronalium phyllosphericum CENA369 TaxID=1725256 RepID=A0A8J7IAL8_9NOST|nr:hypothetical protein [Dendronalium phyllosphericum]MBH8575930.1 hypothetical protein [Dendronalium phyllosphericum CENA369]